MTETSTVASTLRKQFPLNQVGKLPRVTCPDCSDRRKTCTRHDKAKCSTCLAYVSTQHIHIDYVGHADVTSRLLEADPEWNWAPRHRDITSAILAAAAGAAPDVAQQILESAPPKFDLDDQGNPVGFWISLTVGGITRPGYGSVPSGQPDAVKVLIGDALRNAAMRFGVALDLWAKGDRADPTAENATTSGGNASRRAAGEAVGGPGPRTGSSGRQGGSPPNGRAVRPAGQEKTPPSGARDEDAQVFADEAAAALTLTALKAVNEQAVKAGKIAATIASPLTGALGQLGLFIEWKRKQLAAAENALNALMKAAGTMPIEDLELHMKKVTGATIDGATAAQLRQAAEALKAA